MGYNYYGRKFAVRGRQKKVYKMIIGKELNRETREFPSLGDNENILRETLRTVYDALSEKGYNPVSQLVGYILSEDPTYITNHKNARTLITRFDRDEVLEALVKYYLGV